MRVVDAAAASRCLLAVSPVCITRGFRGPQSTVWLRDDGTRLIWSHGHGCLGNELFLVASHLGAARRLGCSLCLLPVLASRLTAQGFRVAVPPCAPGAAPRRVQAQVGGGAGCDACRTYGAPDWVALRHAVGAAAGAAVSMLPFLQNRHFFEPHLAAVREALAFAPEVRQRCSATVRAFRARHSGRPMVSMHARAGDYLALGHSPDPDYYLSSLERVLQRQGGARACALVVSNSGRWVREYLLPSLRRATGGCAELAEGGSSTEDMCILASGDFVVIGGGSFSYFGAVLARNSSATFYTQRQWLFGSVLHRPEDYYPSTWVSDVRTDL